SQASAGLPPARLRSSQVPQRIYRRAVVYAVGLRSLCSPSQRGQSSCSACLGRPGKADAPAHRQQPPDARAVRAEEMHMASLDSFACRRHLDVGDTRYNYFSLPDAASQLGDIARLPHSLKILLENLLRWEDGNSVSAED